MLRLSGGEEIILTMVSVVLTQHQIIMTR